MAKMSKPKKYQQNKEVTSHFHPRRLARAVVHSRLDRAGISGANKTPYGVDRSPFARNWRSEASVVVSK